MIMNKGRIVKFGPVLNIMRPAIETYVVSGTILQQLFLSVRSL
jgi:hypothetical protein